MRRTNPLLFVAIFLLLLVAPIVVRYLQFYLPGGGDAPPPPDYDPAQVAAVSAVPTPAASPWNETPAVGQGRILLDLAHDNEFELAELDFLDGRLAARGFALVAHEGGNLAAKLRGVNALLIIAPLKQYTTAEIQAVTEFVAGGGRLLLIGDPTRFAVTVVETEVSLDFEIDKDNIPLNSVANPFGLVFNGDYLYNTVENEGNFRNIILQDDAFAAHSLTADLARLVFYGAHSLQTGPGTMPLLTADDNTWSSATDRPGNLTLAALAANGRVLALGDLNFLAEPYYSVYDNQQFIGQIADFLTETAGRRLQLADFPYFFGADIDLVYAGNPELGPDAFDEIITLQAAFDAVGKRMTLAAAPSGTRDTLYLGIYNQAADLAQILASAGISLTIDPPILPPELASAQPVEDPDPEDADETDTLAAEDVRHIVSDLGRVRMSGTALLLLHETDDRRQLVVLAASGDGLESVVDRLLALIPLAAADTLADCLVQEAVALCPTGVTDEPVEAELESGGVPETEAPDTEAGAGEDTAAGDLPPDLIDQGEIDLEDTVTGDLEADAVHGWTFREGPATIDILLQSDELDLVLTLYGPDNAEIERTDAGLAGDSETLTAVEIEADAAYTIVVNEFFGAPGEYTLTVTRTAPAAAEPAPGGADAPLAIFVFADDNGDPLNDGFTSADEIVAALGPEPDVSVWTSTVDGPLTAAALNGADLLIWDTGDYRDEEGFLDPDAEVIFQFLEDSSAGLLVIGSSPVLFSYLDTSLLADLAFVGSDSVLLDGFASGEVVELDQAYPAVVPDFAADDAGADEVVFIQRGPESEDSGGVVAVASSGESFTGQKTILLLFPYGALPAAVQGQLMVNLLAWFDF